jgi:hypothetical protein
MGLPPSDTYVPKPVTLVRNPLNPRHTHKRKSPTLLQGANAKIFVDLEEVPRDGPGKPERFRLIIQGINWVSKTHVRITLFDAPVVDITPGGPGFATWTLTIVDKFPVSDKGYFYVTSPNMEQEPPPPPTDWSCNPRIVVEDTNRPYVVRETTVPGGMDWWWGNHH